MSPLFIYLLKSVTSIILLYLCYSLILKKEPIFKFNRYFLLTSLIISALLPLFEFNLFELFSTSKSLAPNYLATYQLTEISLDEIVIQGQASRSWFSPIHLVLFIYLGGVVFKLIQLGFRLSQLLIFAQKHRKLSVQGSKIIITEKDIPTFSFFKLIFIDETTYYNNKGVESIIKHEEVHITQFHSLDLLLAEFITIIQWFNPFVYSIKKSIKDNHEFIADQEVVSTNNNYSSYKLLLMEQASIIKTNILTHNFSYSLIKRRLNMINKPKKPLRIGIGLFGSILALGIVLFACSTPEKQEITTTDAPEIEQIEEAFTVVEVMPEYPGGMDSLVAFLGNNIKYPQSAKDAGVEGTVYVNFIVEKDGSVSSAKTTRSVSENCDTEAIRVVSSMPDWIPGMQNNKTVRVSFNLPISFKLSDKKAESKITRIIVIDDINNDSVFEVVEQMPEYPGGFAAMSTYLGKNIKYPEQAKKDKISGRVFVSFVVEKDGVVSGVKILRGIGGGCDEEALRVVSAMPNWKPGKNDAGKAVRVKYNLPIKFALD